MSYPFTNTLIESQFNLIMPPTYKLFVRIRYILHKLMICLYYAFLASKGFLICLLLHAYITSNFATII